MKKTIFTGAGVAIVTPRTLTALSTFDKLGELIDFNIDNGTDAIIICGTTGEKCYHDRRGAYRVYPLCC